MLKPQPEVGSLVAANDNSPSKEARLEALRRRYGGRVALGSLVDCRMDGEIGVLMISGDGTETFRPKDGGTKDARILEPREAPRFIVASKWASKPVPQREWFIQDLIPARTVTILNGDGGVGKSLLGLQFACAAAMGCETLGLTPTADRALYIGAEDEEGEFQRRVEDIAASMDRDVGSLHGLSVLPLADTDATIALPDKTGRMQPTELWLDICEYAAKFKPRFVVLDTAADLFGGDEIKRAHVRSFVAMLRQFAIEGDCAVLLLAHPSLEGMRTGSGSSGSTAWNNSVRSRLYLTKPTGEGADPDARILRTVKANYGTAGNEMKLRWKSGAFVLDDGKPSPASAIVAANAERVFREAISAMSRSGERVAKTNGVNYAPKVISKRPEAKGISVNALEAAMHTLLSNGELKIVMEGPPSKQRQRIILAAEDFGPND